MGPLYVTIQNLINSIGKIIPRTYNPRIGRRSPLKGRFAMRLATLVMFTLCTFALHCDEQLISSTEENLSLRRIADFWQEGEYQIAKHQIEHFLTLFPDSIHSETLQAALGDLYMKEKNYLTALDHYAQTNSKMCEPQLFLNKLHCLYQLQWHATLADECEAYLAQNPALEKEFYENAAYLLAISLYQLSLNNASDAKMLGAIAKRAAPYFEALQHTTYAFELAQARAHMYTLLQEFDLASAIYLELAKNQPEAPELLFQAAQLLSKHDQKAALDIFYTIAAKNCFLSKEAIYNALVLLFEDGQFAQIIDNKTTFLESVDIDKTGIVHLIVGKSLLSLNEYTEASSHLCAYLNAAQSSEETRAVLLLLVEAAYHASDLAIFDEALSRLRAFDAQDPELPKALFARAQMHKNQGRLKEAKEQLEALLLEFPHFEKMAEASFELIHLAKETQDWHACSQMAHAFLTKFSSHPLACFAWRYLAASSFEIAKNQRETKQCLAADLEAFLQNCNGLEKDERAHWSFHLAKTYFELEQFDAAIELLLHLVNFEPPNQQKANCESLLAFCYRYGKKDEEQFIEWTAKAIQDGQTLLPLSQLRICLFNSYSAREQSDLAAQQLYRAFEEGADIQLQNLLWLADFLYLQAKQDINNVPLAATFFSKLFTFFNVDVQNIQTETMYLEQLFVRFAELETIQDHPERAQKLLETLEVSYETNATLPWELESRVRVRLGEIYLARGQTDLAARQFARVENTFSTMRDPFAATAKLYSARLKLASLSTWTMADIAPIASKLKDLSIQKTLASEPTHLEAALDYIDLQMKLEPSKEKKRKLFLRMKQDFEADNDLLSKDYHVSRLQNPEQNELFLAYMQYVDAQILLNNEGIEEKELQAKGEDLLMQLKTRKIPGPLLERIH